MKIKRLILLATLLGFVNPITAKAKTSVTSFILEVVPHTHEYVWVYTKDKITAFSTRTEERKAPSSEAIFYSPKNRPTEVAHVSREVFDWYKAKHVHIQNTLYVKNVNKVMILESQLPEDKGVKVGQVVKGESGNMVWPVPSDPH